jgi:uncharacterized membrane protein (UPF0127 family)
MPSPWSLPNDAERSPGLMFRKKLPDGHGMLFDFEKDQPVAFWMHNTYVSLDMIFITGDGRILRIAENTRPLSDRLIPSGGPVRAVPHAPVKAINEQTVTAQHRQVTVNGFL